MSDAPRRCYNCGQPIRRVTADDDIGDLRDEGQEWVHVEDGSAVCDMLPLATPEIGDGTEVGRLRALLDPDNAERISASSDVQQTLDRYVQGDQHLHIGGWCETYLKQDVCTRDPVLGASRADVVRAVLVALEAGDE